MYSARVREGSVGSGLLDEQGRILDCDAAFASCFEPRPCRGEPLRRWVADLPESIVGELVVRHPSRATIVELRFVPVDPALRPLAHQVVAIPICADNEALRRELSVAHQTLRSLVDAAPITIVTTDLAMNVSMWNQAGERMFGWSEAELLGKPYPLVPERDQVTFDRLLAQVHGGEGFTGVEAERLRKDGSMIPVRMHTAPRRDAEGVVIGGLAILEDLSHTRALERQKMEAIGRLAGGVAHDFNNLLAVILGMTELLGDDPELHAGAREQIEEIRRASESARRITAQLLTFGRREVVMPRVVEVHEAIRSTTPLLRRLVGETITLEIELDAAPAEVRIDTAQLEQILLNLAINARDAMPSGGALRITSRRTSSGDRVELEIADSGTGIPPEVLPHVFEPFYTTKPFGQGTGLGLATVFGIVRASGGTIEIETALGQGTRFRVSLPLTLPSPPALDPSASVRASSASLARGDERLLVVDDDPGVRRSISKLLASLGYSIASAADGADALAQVEALDPSAFDLVLTDLDMPNMTGTELAAQLREGAPTLPIIFMSGNLGSAALRAEIAAGQATFLQKPITLAVLAKCIRQALDSAARSPRPA